MSKIVFVLGAGASAHCGTPLMNKFLEEAQDLLRLGEVQEVRKHFESVFDAIQNLHASQLKAKIDTYNIEDVYSAFEMGNLLGSLPGTESNEMEKLTSSIKKVIGYTLERTTKLPNDNEQRPASNIAYFQFADIIKKLIEQGKDCSIITFNYDLGLDYSLQYNNIFSDYGLNDTPLTSRRSVPVPYLKLHGSLNWGRCTRSECKKIIPHRELRRTVHESYSTIPIISKLKTMKCKCGEPLEEDPFIVPPTWDKTRHQEQIKRVWKKAASELKEAEHIFIIGYSLPDTDMFFRYLFALGSDVRTMVRGIYVFNIDSTVEERLRNLLGSGVSQRFQFYNVSFENAIGIGPFLMGVIVKTIPQILNIQVK
jgi:NAD-dependent SIR2 family protein deacetylase